MGLSNFVICVYKALDPDLPEFSQNFTTLSGKSGNVDARGYVMPHVYPDFREKVPNMRPYLHTSCVGFCVARSDRVGNARSLGEWSEQSVRTTTHFFVTKSFTFNSHAAGAFRFAQNQSFTIMKKILVTLFAAVLGVSAFAGERPAGYRGFIDAGYIVTTSKLTVTDGWNDYDVDMSNRVTLTTSHGYQFNPYFFAGAGLGVEYWHESEDGGWSVPIFADLRFDYSFGDLMGIFVDAKVGYSVADIEGFTFHPKFGVRFALGEKMGLNVGVGYPLQKIKDIDGICGGVSITASFDF